MPRRHAEPATLTAHHDCEFREGLDRVGDKWTLLKHLTNEGDGDRALVTSN
jgi:DNA-binding HxlR family transcriptional regulator